MICSTAALDMDTDIDMDMDMDMVAMTIDPRTNKTLIGRTLNHFGQPLADIER